MAVKQVKFNDTFIYVDDEVDEKDTGIRFNEEKVDEETKVIETIEDDSLNKTSVIDEVGNYE